MGQRSWLDMNFGTAERTETKRSPIVVNAEVNVP